MGGRGKLGNKKKKRDDEKALTRMDEEIRPEGPSPFSVDLIRKVIFSHLEDEDLLNARLVAKDWSSLATEEFRGRKTIFPWIPGGGEPASALDEESAVGFMDVMTLSLPLIPVQQIGLRLDLLSIEPSTLLRLLTFIAPWVRALRLVPWTSSIDVRSPLGREEGRKAMAWSSALNSFPPLDFPRLEALDLKEEEECEHLHQSVAMSMVNLMTKVVQGARKLQRLSYFALFFGNGNDDDETVDMDREATKGIMSALPPSLKILSFGPYCAVDYGALTTLHLNLEDFFWEGKLENPQEFREFLEGQKTGLKRLHFLNLEDIYDLRFPNFPFVTKLGMAPSENSTFQCLTAFPALLTLQVHIGSYPPDTIGPGEIDHLRTHQGVRKLVISHLEYGMIQIGFIFTVFSHVLPNLTHVDFTCMDNSDLIFLFTQLPRLVSLKLTGDFTAGDVEGFQSILTGLHPSVFEMAKEFDILDAEGFHAVEVIGSRRGNSTIGLWNLKDLQVLDISSESPEECSEVFLSKLTFGTVFMKMRSLKEIRIGVGELPKACEPVAEALGNKGIHVQVYTV